MPIFFITSAIWRCIFRSLFTSETSTPEPSAMRLRREPFSTSGFLRSSFVIERMIASWRFKHPVVEAGGRQLILHLADAGQHAEDALHAAHAAHLAQLFGEIVEIELALLHFLGERFGFFGVDRFGGLLDEADDVALAENAPGHARGWKSSSASIFSPVPSSLIGAPVIARIESAAPPRPSPSMRVRTMPEVRCVR